MAFLVATTSLPAGYHDRSNAVCSCQLWLMSHYGSAFLKLHGPEKLQDHKDDDDEIVFEHQEQHEDDGEVVVEHPRSR